MEKGGIRGLIVKCLPGSKKYFEVARGIDCPKVCERTEALSMDNFRLRKLNVSSSSPLNLRASPVPRERGETVTVDSCLKEDRRCGIYGGCLKTVKKTYSKFIV